MYELFITSNYIIPVSGTTACVCVLFALAAPRPPRPPGLEAKRNSDGRRTRSRLLLAVLGIYKKGKRQKSVYRLVTAPQGGTQKYTLAIAYDSPADWS